MIIRPATERDIEALIMLLPSVHAAYSLKRREKLSEVEFLRTALVLVAAERRRYQAALYDMVKYSPLPPIHVRDHSLWTHELIHECLESGRTE
jgi:hypothetical protein